MKATQSEIERIQSLYDDAIENDERIIRNDYQKQIADLETKMRNEINYMHHEQRTAMYKEMQVVKQA